MKILHCADIHLDSAMTANLDKDKARERRNELLASFKDMVGYAVKERIGVIIIAGDLFDTRNISVGAKKEVYNIIINNPGITFYYLQGNHDNGSFVSYLDEIPANLRMFGKEWTSYNAGIINNCGIIPVSASIKCLYIFSEFSPICTGKTSGCLKYCTLAACLFFFSLPLFINLIFEWSTSKGMIVYKSLIICPYVL